MKVEIRGFENFKETRRVILLVEIRTGCLCVKMQAITGGIFYAPTEKTRGYVTLCH
jgi:hypothetical protein